MFFLQTLPYLKQATFLKGKGKAYSYAYSKYGAAN